MLLHQPTAAMALEIERRFLVRGDQWRQQVGWEARLEQGYLLASADGLTVRVRRAWGAPAVSGAWLTLKARLPARGAGGLLEPEGLVRQEFEYPIPQGDATALLALAPEKLSKCRYGLNLPGGEWVVDVFEADNAPLVVAEVELDPEALVPEAPLAIPPWCVAELTGRHRLSNASLARCPLARWPEQEREELLRLSNS
jgi:adenylate cyclase